jgi:hypothetical protein
VRENGGERPIDWDFEESRVRGYEGRGGSGASYGEGGARRGEADRLGF